MSNLTFIWVPSLDLEEDNSPRLLEAQFGDGYSQASPDGINNNPRSWQLQFDYRNQAEFTAMRQFLVARGGWDVFWWLNPVDGYFVRVRCTNFKPKVTSPTFYYMGATFEEQFDMAPVNGLLNPNLIVGQ